MAVTIMDRAKTMISDTSSKLMGVFNGEDGVKPVEDHINTPEQQTLYTSIEYDYNVAKSARQQVEPLWREEQRFWWGDHWYGLRTENTSRYRPNCVDNIAFSQCESIVGKLCGWDPVPDFQAQEPNDEQKANDLNDFVPYEMRKIKFKKKYTTAIRRMVIHGPLIFKTIYDPNVEGGRGLNRYVGQNDIIPVELGSFFPDPRITDFIYLQDMGFIIINTRKTLEYFQKRWPEQGPKVQPDEQAQDVEIFTYPNYNAQQNTFNYTDTTWGTNYATVQSKTAGLIEYWYRGLPKMMTDEDKQLFEEQAQMLLSQGKDPSEALAKAGGTMEGIHCAYQSTSGVFLEHKSYVYDHGEYPFAARTLYPNDRNVWGKGFMRDMIKPQISLNKMKEIALITMAKQGSSAIVYEEGAITKPQTWKEQRSQDGSMLPIAQGRMNDWKELQGVNAPQTIFNLIQHDLDILQKIPGQFDSANGQASPNVTSGEQAKALISAASTRLNTVTDAIQETLQEVFSQYVELIAQFYTDKRIARVTGRNVAMGREALVSGAPTSFGVEDNNVLIPQGQGEVQRMPMPMEMQQTTVDGQQASIDLTEEYVPCFDIIVNISAEKPTDREYWIQMAFNMLPMVDPITKLPMIDAEGVRYTIQNGRMEPMNTIERRIVEKSGIMQQIQQMQMQIQQMQIENQTMKQNLAELGSQKMQNEQQDREFNQRIQQQKVDLETAKTVNEMANQQQPA